MDETNHRWFRWVAGNSKFFFWGVWGAGAGVFIAVSLQVVPSPEGTLRFYLTILTTAMAAIAGLVSSRAMDSISDRRARRRRILVLTLQVASLLMALRALCSNLAQANAERPEIPSIDVAIGLLVSAADVKANNDFVPNFEDILDDHDDVEQAKLLQLIQINLKHNYGWVDLDTKVGTNDETRTAGGRIRGPTNQLETAQIMVQTLETISAHFGQKLRA